MVDAGRMVTYASTLGLLVWAGVFVYMLLFADRSRTAQIRAGEIEPDLTDSWVVKLLLIGVMIGTCIFVYYQKD